MSRSLVDLLLPPSVQLLHVISTYHGVPLVRRIQWAKKTGKEGGREENIVFVGGDREWAEYAREGQGRKGEESGINAVRGTHPDEGGRYTYFSESIIGKGICYKRSLKERGRVGGSLFRTKISRLY